MLEIWPDHIMHSLNVDLEYPLIKQKKKDFQSEAQ